MSNAKGEPAPLDDLELPKEELPRHETPAEPAASAEPGLEPLPDLEPLPELEPAPPVEPAPSGELDLGHEAVAEEPAHAVAPTMEFQPEPLGEDLPPLPDEGLGLEPVEGSAMTPLDQAVPMDSAQGQDALAPMPEAPADLGEPLPLGPEAGQLGDMGPVPEGLGQLGATLPAADMGGPDAMAATLPVEEGPQEPAEPEPEPEPRESIFHRLAQSNPYSVLLGMSLAAVLLAILLLFLELAAFNFDIGAKGTGLAAPPAQSAPANTTAAD